MTAVRRGHRASSAEKFERGTINGVIDFRELSEEEWHAEQDAVARHYMNMSREEFIKGWENGELHLGHDHPLHCQIVPVVMMFPELE